MIVEAAVLMGGPPIVRHRNGLRFPSPRRDAAPATVGGKVVDGSGSRSVIATRKQSSTRGIRRPEGNRRRHRAAGAAAIT